MDQSYLNPFYNIISHYRLRFGKDTANTDDKGQQWKALVRWLQNDPPKVSTRSTADSHLSPLCYSLCVIQPSAKYISAGWQLFDIILTSKNTPKRTFLHQIKPTPKTQKSLTPPDFSGIVRLFPYGAEGGIRTLVCVSTNWFRVSPVMTTSIPLHNNDVTAPRYRADYGRIAAAWCIPYIFSSDFW